MLAKDAVGNMFFFLDLNLDLGLIWWRGGAMKRMNMCVWTIGFRRDEEEGPLHTVCAKSRGHRRVQSHERKAQYQVNKMPAVIASPIR